MAHSRSVGQSRDDTFLTLKPSLRRSSSEKRSWNKAGHYPVMPTNLVVSEGSSMALRSSLAYKLEVFVRPNEDWLRGECGGDSGVSPER
jgi:hypothetical protein